MIEPSEIYLVQSTITINMGKRIAKERGESIRMHAAVQATPLPPLNLWNTGNICPSTTKSALIAPPTVIERISEPIRTAIIALEKSMAKIRAAILLP